jgi:endonuclease-3
MDSSTAIQQLKSLKKFVDKNIETPRLAAEGWDEEWKVLFSPILSAQTRDEKTIEVCEKLFKKFNSVGKFANASLKSIRAEIKSINYYKTKAKNLKNCALMLVKKYHGEIPKTFEELIELPGVGRKTANVFLSEARNEQTIGVDTHVARLSQKLGWTKNKDPHKIEEDLKKLFPQKKWSLINDVLVRFGRSVGKSRKNEDEVLEAIRRKVYK